MKNTVRLLGLPIICLLLTSPLAHSAEHSHQQDDHEHEGFREQHAHEHGAALLNVATEDNKLYIEFESPAMNIVGFEHAAHNSDDKKAVQDAANLLKQGLLLFKLPTSAKCHQTDADIVSSLLKSEHHSAKHHEQHKDEMHSEFQASYTFQCQNIGALNTMDVRLFAHFKSTEEIKVQLITDQGQTEKELTAQQTLLDF